MLRIQKKGTHFEIIYRIILTGKMSSIDPSGDVGSIINYFMKSRVEVRAIGHIWASLFEASNLVVTRVFVVSVVEYG